MRRLKALEIKEPVPVNQVSPTPCCIYCQAMNHVFEEYHVFLAHQILPEHMNAACATPNNNPYSQTYNLDWRNYPNFSRGQNTNEQLGPTFSTISNHPIINKIFPTKFYHLLSKIHKWRQH